MQFARTPLSCNSDAVSFEITYHGKSNFNGVIELVIGPSPCGSSHQVKVSVDGVELDSGSLSNAPITLRTPVAFVSKQKYGVAIQQTGSLCTIKTDWRNFMTMINFPRLISART